MWCIAELDQAYIQKMEDVLALYEKPSVTTEPVVCLDEKPVSLHADVRPARPARPGHLAKRDNECATARPTSSRSWNRKPGAISHGRHRTARPANSHG